jgi:hypothetical protein
MQITKGNGMSDCKYNDIKKILGHIRNELKRKCENVHKFT